MTMTHESCNCIICAREFDPTELHNIVLSKINITKFKVCEACLESNPEEDYKEVRSIIARYNATTEAQKLFGEVKNILQEIDKQL